MWLTQKRLTMCCSGVHYPFARLVWALSPIPAPQEGTTMQSLYSNVYHVLNIQKEYRRDDVQADIVPWLLWSLRKKEMSCCLKDNNMRKGVF